MGREASVFLRLVLAGCLMIAMIFCSTAVFAGKMELTTYYPAPFGEYQELSANKLKVGSHTTTTTAVSAGATRFSDQISGLADNEGVAGDLYYDNSAKNFKYHDGNNWKNFGSGGVSYTANCFVSADLGTPVCPASVTIGEQGPCISGFTVRAALGSWGICYTAGFGSYNYFLPPVGSCPAPYGSGAVGQAYVCSQ